MSLKYTADQVRDRESAMIGKGKHPNAWWAWTAGSDCMAGQAYALGIRTNRASSTAYEISIAAFRSHFGWDEVPLSEARAGDLVAEFWPEAGQAISRVPNHIEYIHGIDYPDTITTDSANTGPRPGEDTPRGFYRKTRTLGPNFLFAIRPPYKGAADTSPYGAKAPTGLAKKDVKVVAAFLNDKIGKPHTNSVQDGITGPNYWTLVQTWGRQANIYGPGYKIDGIVGPRTRQVEAVILKRAKAAAKK